MVYCPECGVEITPEDIFCGNCGITLTPIVPAGEDIKDAPISEAEANDSGKASSQNSVSEAVAKDQSVDVSDEKTFESEQEKVPIQELEKTEFADENLISPQPVSIGEQSFEFQKSNDQNFEKNKKTEEQPKEDWEMQAESVELQPLANEVGENELTQNSSEVSAIKQEPEFNSYIKDKAELNSFADDFSNENPGESNSNNEFLQNSFSEQPSFASSAASEIFEQTIPVDSAKIAEDNNFIAEDEKIIQENIGAVNSQEIVKDEVKTLPVDQDFQATIPYTPTDFAQQKIVATKLAEEKPVEKFEPNKLSVSDSEKFAISEDSAPITPPEVPVGSSPNDSLEPTSISVQIYDPKQKPEDVEPATLLNSPEDVKAIVEQAKSEQQPARESRPYTSPNMTGGDTDGKGKAKLKPLDEGTILNNRYEVVRKIGGGGMGSVYLASDKNLGGISRAVKEMVQSYIEDSQQEKAVNDFRRESMLLTSLEHPSIPTIYDYFFDETEARFYLVMKYIAGGDLAARLRSASEGKIDEATVTDWGIQLADVLDYLHNRQPPIVYRDLKPSNIMIDSNTGKVMLIDFGIARWVNKEEKGVTAVGTMGYAPPELFSGNVEPRSDIYSLGSTMFHLLTGADPQSNPLLIFDFHKHPRPRQINSQLTDQMEQILMKMVEYTAAKRFESAAELKEVLISHLDNLKKGKVTIGVADSQLSASPAANMPVFCGFCGQKILAADVFCPFCGAQQAATAGQGSPTAQPKATARLVIIGTNELDSPIFKLEKEDNLVGRRDPMSNIFPEVDLSKFDPQTKISRRHARIWRDRESFLVEDLGSSNGTTHISRTNESRKLGRNQPQALTSGDKIRVGDTTLHFVFD